MPKQLEPGVLYVAEHFGAAAHLCACGCGAKIRTPLGPVDWSLKETKRGPTLYPSIGNWQQACRSHYWIRAGEIIWAEKWTLEEIAAGRAREQQRARAYYDNPETDRKGLGQRLWQWLREFFGLS